MFQSVSWWLALFFVQDARSQADRVRTAMEASLAQQRASVQKQAQALGTTLPWTPPLTPIPCDPLPQPELSKMIDEVAEKQGVDKSLVLEVARQESGFRPCAVSAKGAEGLMQLMPETQAQFQVSDPFDPRQSLEAGSKLLKTLLERYHGDLSLALSAYNAGPGRVDKARAVPDIAETKNYVFSILTRFLR